MTAPEPVAGPRRIEYMPLDDLVEAHRNPKSHDDDLIGNSITRFGFADASILDERTGRLIAGHGRFRNLRNRRDAGDAAPDGIVADDNGTWLVPVQRGWASRSDEDAEGFLITHNRSGETGGWDNRALAEILDELRDTAPDVFDTTGFTSDDLDAMLHDFATDRDLDDLGDEFGEPEERDTWPRLSLAVPPETRQMYNDLRKTVGGDEEHEQFGAILNAARSALDG